MDDGEVSATEKFELTLQGAESSLNVEIERPKNKEDDLLQTSATYCAVCESYSDAVCSSHGALEHICDTPRQPLAISSLPSRLLLKTVKGRKVVYSKHTMKRNIIFGPYVSPYSTVTLAQSLQNGGIDPLNADRDKHNWMMFIKKTENQKELSLHVIQLRGEIYFVTCRSVQAGQELMYGVGEDTSTPQHKCHECKTCPAKFSSAELARKHSSYCRPSQKKRGSNTTDNNENQQITSESLIKPPVAISPTRTILPKPVKKENIDKSTSGDLQTSVRERQVCEECGLTFRSVELLSIHYNIHIKDEIPDTILVINKTDSSKSSVKTPEICPVCNRVCPDMITLSEHVTSKHTIRTSKTRASERDYTSIDDYHSEQVNTPTFTGSPRRVKVRQFPCEHCDRKFQTFTSLRAHMKFRHFHIYKTLATKFKCILCRMEFSSSKLCGRHLLTHSNPDGSFTCNQCNGQYSGPTVLRRHVIGVHTSTRVLCTVCNKQLKDNTKLRQHMLIHSQEKHYMCHVCAKQFNREDRLSDHIRRLHGINTKIGHPRLQPAVPSTDYQRFIYKCIACQLGFKRRGMLVNHLNQKHPKQSIESIPELNLPILRQTRQYYCTVCPRAYKSSSKRKLHMLHQHPGVAVPQSFTHQLQASDGGLTEEILNPSFTQQTAAIPYMPFNCDYCHKQYANRKNLTDHLRKTHADRLHIQPEQNMDENTDIGLQDEVNQNISHSNTELLQHEHQEELGTGTDGTLLVLSDPLASALSSSALTPTLKYLQPQGLTDTLGLNKDLELSSQAELHNLDLTGAVPVSQTTLNSNQTDLQSGNTVLIDASMLQQLTPVYSIANQTQTFSFLTTSGGQTITLTPQQLSLLNVIPHHEQINDQQ